MNDRAAIQEGVRVGLLTAVEISGKSADGHHKWLCLYDCGGKIIRSTNSLNNALRAGAVSSCGCAKPSPNKSHGMRGTPTYSSWMSAKQRCHNEDAKSYDRYGGVGIHMAEEWRNSFDAFMAHMGTRPAGTTLDRIDGTKGYEPGNCRWATTDVQANNKKNSVRTVIDGVEVTAKELAARIGISHCAAIKRIKRGRIHV